MKLLFVAQKSVANNTSIRIVDSNTIEIDGETYQFPIGIVSFDQLEVSTQSQGHIVNAEVIDGTLYLSILRQFTGDCEAWNDGKFHEYREGWST